MEVAGQRVSFSSRRPEPWWSAEREPDLASQFALFLDHLVDDYERVRELVESLSAGTGFAAEARKWSTFLTGLAKRFANCVEDWSADYRRVIEQWEAEGRSGAAAAKFRMNALAHQARELRETTVVEEFGNRKFLPRYGFPIGLNSLVVNERREVSVVTLSDVG
jgi:hypothetical protein